MNKKSICLFFTVHQPTRLRQYRFFDIGKDSHYYDDFANRNVIRRAIQECYLPMNAILLDLLKTHKGAFKLAFSISGATLELFERYAPEVIESFKALSDTARSSSSARPIIIPWLPWPPRPSSSTRCSSKWTSSSSCSASSRSLSAIRK